MKRSEIHYKKDEIVLSGGGTKGLIMFGILRKINEYYPIEKFQYITGCSIGSLIAAMIAVGCNIDEIEDILVDLNWLDYFDVKIMNLIENMGMIDAFKMQNFFRAVMSYKDFPINVTFKELYEKTGKVLTIVVTNITKRKSEYLNYLTSPDMNISLSLIMSISIPIVFQPIRFNNNYYLDGGILDQYPYYYNENTRKIGICVFDRDIFKEVEEIKNSFQQVEEESFQIFSYTLHILETLWEEYNKLKLKSKKPKDTILISNIEANAIDFNMEESSKRNMIEIGKKIGEKYFMKEYRKRRIRYLQQKYIHLWISKIRR